MNPQTEQNSVPDQNQQPIVAPPPPPPPKSKLPFFLIGGLLVILVLVGGYKLMSNSSTPPPQPTPEPQQPSPNISSTENWKTYKDQEWHFSINYPSNWYLFEKNTAGTGNSIVISSFNITNNAKPNYDKELRIDITRTQTNLSLQDYINSEESRQILSTNTEPINGIEAITQEVEGLGTSKMTYISYNGYIYIVSYFSNSQLSKVGDQILSTFTFLDQNQLSPTKVIEGTTWKTYIHDGFPNLKKRESWLWSGFRLYYPPTWSITENVKSEEDGSLLLTFKKEDGSYFRIVQGFGGGGRCLFPEETDYDTFQGAGSQYNTYIQIDKSDTVRWRLAHYKVPDDLWSHSLCDFIFTNGTYSSGNGNVIGIDTIKLTTENSYNEFVEILNKLEITGI